MRGAPINPKHQSELIDEHWNRVADAARTDVRLETTGTVHLEDCPHFNSKTGLRLVQPTDVIVHRCEHCRGRQSERDAIEVRRVAEAVQLEQARAADPDLSRRVRERIDRRRHEYGF